MIRSLIGQWTRKRFGTGTVKTKGDRPHPIANLEWLSDEQLKELNTILDWNCFTLDEKRRKFGKAASNSKRIESQRIPDWRAKIINENYPLKDKSVVEVGCFEGIHTISLCQFGARVKALDSRIENVVKTMVRLGFYGEHADVYCMNLENLGQKELSLLSGDVLHHAGVLYHLADPVGHMHQLLPQIKDLVFLDTQYATEEMAKNSYETPWGRFSYHRYGEHGYREVFSGMKDHAKWLRLEDLQNILRTLGFSKQRIVKDTINRNGPRVAILAER